MPYAIIESLKTPIASIPFLRQGKVYEIRAAFLKNSVSYGIFQNDEHLDIFPLWVVDLERPLKTYKHKDNPVIRETMLRMMAEVKATMA